MPKFFFFFMYAFTTPGLNVLYGRRITLSCPQCEWGKLIGFLCSPFQGGGKGQMSPTTGPGRDLVHCWGNLAGSIKLTTGVNFSTGWSVQSHLKNVADKLKSWGLAQFFSVYELNIFFLSFFMLESKQTYFFYSLFILDLAHKS